MREMKLQLEIKDNYRIIAISDVHGHIDVLKQLLEEVNLTPSDHLVFIGDFINKGPSNLEAIHYMMALEKRPNTYILKGNHEYFICHYMYLNEDITPFMNYMKEDHFTTILHDMCKTIGYDLYNCQDAKDFQSTLMNTYKEEFDYINNLPIILFADDFVFVHGGYDDSLDITASENQLLKFDDFNNISKVQEATVVVGHWPTANLRTDVNTNLPIFNFHKNIISIDGGIGVKQSGEMNALIIDKRNGETVIDYVQANHFDRVKIIKAHTFEMEEKIFVNYPHFDIELIEQGPLTSKCLHKASNKTLTIFNDILETIDDTLQVKTTYINHFLNLDVGEMVEVCMVYDQCALVKYHNEFGWVLKEQLDL